MHSFTIEDAWHQRVLGIALVVEEVGKFSKLAFRYPPSPPSHQNSSQGGRQSKEYDHREDNIFFSLPSKVMAKLFRTKPALCGQLMTLSIDGTIFCCRSVLLNQSHAGHAGGVDDLGKNRFLRHGGRLQRPTSWMVCQTLENLPTLKHTLGSTSASHGNSRPRGSKTPLSNETRPPPWESCTPSLPLQLPPPTLYPNTFPTWSPLAYTSTSSPTNTQSAPATAGWSNSGSSWTSCSLSGTSSSPGTPPPSISDRPPKLSPPPTIRRIPSAVRLSPNYVLSPPQTSQSRGINIFLRLRDQGCDPTTSISNFPPIMASTLSAHPTPSPSSEPSVYKWERLELASPQKTLERTLSAMAEPWPRILPMSHNGHSWPLSDRGH